jgi:dihydrofolate reductase
MATNRKFISAMQISLDGFVEDTEGKTDWIDSWAEAISLIDDVDMFILGGKMYPGYGEYWGSIHADPKGVAPNPEVPSQEGRPPSESEISYARYAAKTPHVVLSKKLEKIDWPDNSQIIRDMAELKKLKNMPGKNTYVVGGAGLVASLMDADLIDELRLIVHPIILGAGKPLFKVKHHHTLKFVHSEAGKAGRVILTYQT